MSSSDRRKLKFQHFKCCIKTKSFNQSNILSLTGSYLILGLSKQTDEEITLIPVCQRVTKGAAKAAGLQFGWLLNDDASMRAGLHRR